MADFNDIGNKLFVTMLCVNVFLAMFAAHQLAPTQSAFIDGNVTTYTPSGVLGTQPDVSSDALVKVTGSTELQDVSIETIGQIFDTLKNSIKAALFGFVDFANLYLPPIIGFPITVIFSTFMAFYTVVFIANIFNLIFRGQGGSV